MATILLTGATGKVSSATIGELKGAGHKVIAMVRDLEKSKGLAALGAELRVGDLAKPRALGPVFADVDVALLLAPAGELAPFLSSNALWAAKQAGVKHVVRMSAVGAAHDAPTLNSRMHALSDAELVASGLRYTILKPHFFMQNLMMTAQSIAQQGTFYFALGEAALPVIDVRDIAKVAARVLANPADHANKVYTLTGPAAVTMHTFAKAVADTIGKKVTYVPVPVSAAIESMAKMGVDEYGLTSLGDYFTAYSKGWQNEVTPDVKRITGAEPRSIATFVSDFAAAFGKS